jgi:hypothetical protein
VLTVASVPEVQKVAVFLGLTFASELQTLWDRGVKNTNSKYSSEQWLTGTSVGN